MIITEMNVGETRLKKKWLNALMSNMITAVMCEDIMENRVEVQNKGGRLLENVSEGQHKVK